MNMEYILSIVALLTSILLAWSFGRKILDLTGFHFISNQENFVFSFGLGYGLMAYLVLMLGIAGLLYRWLVILILAICCLFIVAELKKSVTEILKGLTSFKDIFSYPGRAILSISLGIAIAIILCGSLAPSYSNDSMVYHLTDAKYFSNMNYVGKILNNSTNSLWPYLIEMYFTLALLFKLFSLTGLFHCVLAIFTMIGVYAFSKRFFSDRIALLASLIFILTPGIFMEARETYVELGMVFYTFMAFYAFCMWMESKENRWIVISGIMCGIGLSIKYFMIIVPFVFGIYLLYAIFISKKSVKLNIVKEFLLFSISTFLACFTWYLRQYIITGNPVFPFFYKIFGTSGLDTKILELLSEKTIRGAYGIGISLKSFIISLWQITIFPGKFGGEQLGPIFLAIIPALILIKPVDRHIKRILLFSFVYFGAWFFTYQNLRFLLPIAAFLSIVVSYVAVSIDGESKIFKKALGVVMAFCLVSSLALCAYHNFEGIKVVLGLESKDSYLSRNERSYVVSEYINNNLPEYAKVLVVNEGHSFFIDRDNMRELYYWIYTRYDKKYKKPEEVLNVFKERGFTHILYAFTKDSGYEIEGGLLPLMQKDEFRDKYLKLIYEQVPDSKNANGVKYMVYEI